ncbi:MAG: hypothetical protein WBC63_09680 [Candidatus Bipolaricaulia bacterium]
MDEVDRILRAADSDQGQSAEVLEALHEREATLVDYARELAGAVGEVAEVLRLGILARRVDASAAKYIRAFVEVANAFVPIAVRQSIVDGLE